MTQFVLRLAATAVAASLIATACGSSTTPTASEQTPTSEPTPSWSESDERALGIYVAAIKELVLQGNTFREGRNPFDVLYILDHADSDAADTREGQGEQVEISPQLQERLKQELAELGPIEFVADGDSVVGHPQQGSQVQNEGGLITLGTIPEQKKNRVKVGMQLYVANLAATWLTYVIKQKHGEWVVTGTTGPVAIS